MEPVYVLIAAAAAWLFLGGSGGGTKEGAADLDTPVAEDAEERYRDL